MIEAAYFTIKEAAIYLGLGPSSIRFLISMPADPLPHFRPGGARAHIRLSKADLDNFMTKHRFVGLPTNGPLIPAVKDHLVEGQSFIAATCVVSPETSATARDLYSAYLVWARRLQLEVMMQRVFGMMLHALGFKRARGQAGVRTWRGLGLRTADASPSN